MRERRGGGGGEWHLLWCSTHHLLPHTTYMQQQYMAMPHLPRHPPTTRVQWERVKKAGMAPGPRSSFALVPHRSRAFLFGGCSDNEIKRGEDLSSDFHNDLYQFNTVNRRWAWVGRGRRRITWCCECLRVSWVVARCAMVAAQ